MNKFLLSVISIFFITACSPLSTQTTSQKEKACVDSGGIFSDSKCTCPDGTYKFNGKDVPLYNYEESTGLCIDAMGTPGGKKGEEVKALHSQKMKNDPPFNEPINLSLSRISKKPFGIKITKENSPVSPERFSGYHTGVDFEVSANELETDVNIYAVCDGPLVLKKYSSGYGGVAVQQCNIKNSDVCSLWSYKTK